MRAEGDSDGDSREIMEVEDPASDSEAASGARAPPRGGGGGGGFLAGGVGAGNRSVVEELREEVSHIAQELLTHRKVLEQFLEVREGCMQLLEHRESLLELREGMQAVLGSARIMAEIGDKAAELELSLAGVSDNTARHGKAISNLNEQHKRTHATLDAVVRAVKRLDRSRSRCREATPTPSLPPAMPWPLSSGGSRRGGDEVLGMGPSMRGFGSDSDAGGQGELLTSGRGAADWREGSNRQPNNLAFMDAEEALQPPGGPWADDASSGDPRTAATDRYGSGDDAWNWPGWSTGGDKPGLYRSDEDLRRRPSSRSGRAGGVASARGSSSGAGGVHGIGTTELINDRGIPDPSLGGPGDLGSDYRPSPHGGDPGSGGPQANTEMAHCVKGVLARIEEALTKLDGTGPKDGVGGSATDRVGSVLRQSHSGGSGLAGATASGIGASNRATPLPTPRAPDSWGHDLGSARRSGGYARGQRTPSRPQSASSRRGAGAGKSGAGAGGGSAGAYSSTTPCRRQRQPSNECSGDDWPQDLCVASSARRATDSWA